LLLYHLYITFWHDVRMSKNTGSQPWTWIESIICCIVFKLVRKFNIKQFPIKMIESKLSEHFINAKNNPFWKSLTPLVFLWESNLQNIYLVLIKLHAEFVSILTLFQYWLCLTKTNIFEFRKREQVIVLLFFFLQ
jgi:hypothetical protein